VDAVKKKGYEKDYLLEGKPWESAAKKLCEKKERYAATKQGKRRAVQKNGKK